MKRLEGVFLKNVVLYFPTLKDINHFVFINHKCIEIINTLYINPFELTLNHEFSEIVPYFPKLETFYMRRCPKKLLKKHANKIELIEIGNWSCTDKGELIFNNKWFACKVRKMRIREQELELVSKKYQIYTQLRQIHVHGCNKVDYLINVLKIPTLRKFIARVGLGLLFQLKTLFDSRNVETVEVSFIIAHVEHQSTHGGVQELLKKFPKNVTFYTEFLSLDTSDVACIKTQTEFLRANKSATFVYLSAFGKDEEVNKKLRLMDQRNVHLKADFCLKLEFNMTEMYITTLVLEEIQDERLMIKLPKTVKYLSLLYVRLKVDTSYLKLKQLSCTSADNSIGFVIDDEELQSISCVIKHPIQWIHNGEKLDINDIIVDLNKIKEVDIEIFDILNQQGKWKVTRGDNYFVVNPGTLQISDYVATIKTIQDELIINETGIKYLYLSGSTIKSFSTNCPSVTFTRCHLNTLNLENADYVSLNSSVVDIIHAKVINQFNSRDSLVKEIEADCIKKSSIEKETGLLIYNL